MTFSIEWSPGVVAWLIVGLIRSILAEPAGRVRLMIIGVAIDVDCVGVQPDGDCNTVPELVGAS